MPFHPHSSLIRLRRVRSLAVATLALMALACEKPPSDAAIDACVAAYEAAAQQAAAVFEAKARGEQATLQMKSGEVMRACAATFKKPACREAHEHFDDARPEERAVTVLKACAAVYCPELVPRPAACDSGGDRKAVAENHAFWEAVTRHDLGARGDRILAAKKGAGERAARALAPDAGPKKAP